MNYDEYLNNEVHNHFKDCDVDEDDIENEFCLSFFDNLTVDERIEINAKLSFLDKDNDRLRLKVTSLEQDKQGLLYSINKAINIINQN